MHTLIAKVVAVYIIISVVIAVTTIRNWQRGEDDLATVPYGDLEFYDLKETFRYHTRHFIFFPAIFIIKGWIRFCKKVNSKLW